MWSMNARPVETSARPRPSRSTRADSWVSRLLRVTRPFLFKPDLDGMGVGAQALHFRQPDRGIPEGLEVAAIQAQHARPLQERVHPEWRGETRSAWRRQGVIGAGRLVAE